MSKPTYRIDFVTTRPDGTSHHTNLFETDLLGHAQRVRRQVERALSIEPRRRKSRPVALVAVDVARLKQFVKKPSPLFSTQVPVRFESISALAHYMEASPATLRMALSKAKRAGKESATARGVTFQYHYV